ncbi:DgyrCDS6020 [Dimorphilus gyrociliatus]|uniref:Nicastrin n=1 Tax=Dimorphilus gyrociliatus TaxID=2664684 RepID=A0A7I8VPK4_9ANNE|nr:DgyrCDS6020 [Dimorphilus gyrociliatus]
MLILLYLSFLTCLTGAIEKNKLSEKIYISLEGSSVCYLRLNRENTYGCKGAESAVGVLFYMDNAARQQWFKNNARQGPYTLLINPTKNFPFTKELMLEIRQYINDKKVNSLLVTYFGNSTVEQFSPESTCPNHKYDLYSNDDSYKDCLDYNWNVQGTNWLNEYFEIPILALYKADQVEKLIDICWKKRNEPKNDQPPQSPLCAVEIKSQMRGAVNAEVCLRRTGKTTNLNGESKELCTIIGARTIISSYPGPLLQEDKVILVLAQYLTLTMFETLAPGANNPLSGMITLLAVAKALKTSEKELQTHGRSIVFMLFGGETLDYLSSTKLVFDMKNKNFFIDKKQIELIVELSQLAGSKDQIYMHTNKINSSVAISQANEKITQKFTEYSKNIAFKEAKNNILPPASLQSFLKWFEVPGVVLADHNTEFINKFYNSRYDTLLDELRDLPFNTSFVNKSFPLAKKISEIAETITQTIYSLATNKTKTVNVDEIYVSNLLFCLLKNNSCDLLREIIPTDFNLTAGYGDKPTWTRDWHLSVQQSLSRKISTEQLVLSLMANATGIFSHNVTEKQCNSYNTGNKTGLWVNGFEIDKSVGMCIISAIRHHSGLSPGYDPSSIFYNYLSHKDLFYLQPQPTRFLIMAIRSGLRVHG